VTGMQAMRDIARCRVVALDFGGTISTDHEDHVIGQKGVDPRAAAALHELAALGFRLILATNASAAETRWPALQLAGVHELFAVGLVSYSLNVRKDDPLFYELVITAGRCPADQVLFVGDRIDYDVAAPMRAGMQACLVRPGGLRPGEVLPEGALMIRHVRELPGLLELT
jgi:FMN phosphatase YigB (HAD superfamily)